MATHTPRSFEVPSALVAAGFAATVDLDVLDREVEFPGEFGEWAEKVLFQENTKILTDVCGDMRLLPRGILSSAQLDDGSVLVAGLVDSDGRVWDSLSNSWTAPTNDAINIQEETIILDDDEVAFVARAIREGADEVWFRPYIPKAFVSAVVAAPGPPEDRTGKKSRVPDVDPTPEQVPPGSAIIAVVDPIDEDAVLEMLAITPGPRVLRRHDENWFEDPEWVQVLKSVKPPRIVKLTEAQVASVSAQVDRSTDGIDWEPFEASGREQYQIFTASAGTNLDGTPDEIFENETEALTAVAGRQVTPEDVANTERLKRYWTMGPGAAKIRWGTPGAWSRCFKNVSKYMPPETAKGYCTNLSQRLGGPGIATHVAASSSEAVERSSYLKQLQQEADEAALAVLVAVAGRQLTPKDAANTEKLKRYWTVGEGAAKIRWGTPGSWRRCYRHLVKYVGPKVAPGLCTNLSERLGGHGVATHVTSSAEAVTAANPSGVNGYDKGKTFEQSTGGVERDYSGRFAPESGSKRASQGRNRAERRKNSMARRKKERDDKEAKKAGSTNKKADAARNTAEREELAAMALQIAELRSQGKDLEAAELRVKYTELGVQYADTPTQKLNAQAALVNAQDALRERKLTIARKRVRESEQAKRSRILPGKSGYVPGSKPGPSTL